MNQLEDTKVIHLSSTFFYAIKTLQSLYTDSSLHINFEAPNRILIHNWADDNPACINFKSKFDKTMESISVMKLNLPQKKILRIKNMNKWKKQFQIQGLNIFCVKRNFGISYYLIGQASQLHLYKVLSNLQTHSYKTFPTSFIKFIYKAPIETLINCKQYQISIFDKLKITSTEYKIYEACNKNQKKGKFLEMFFELQKYASTKELISKYKEFLKTQFTVCGLMIQREHAQEIKKTVKQSKVNSWKYIQRKRDELVCIYVVCKATTSSEAISQILDQHPEIKFVKFLKGLGKGNQTLQPLIGEPVVETLSPNEKFIYENFEVRGNSHKTPNEISLSLKMKDAPAKWIEAMKILC